MKLSFKFALVSAALFGASMAQAATLTISCGTVGQDYEFCKNAAETWAKENGHKVKLMSIPAASTDILGLYRKLFAAKSKDVDIVVVDVVWPGMIASHLLDLTPYTKGEEKKQFPAIVQNNTVDGKLVAMPWFTDAGVMYYRKDLLEKYDLPVPKTWDEFSKAAATIQEGERKAGDKDFQGFVWQGKAYEGLTCDALEWVASHGGGSVVEPDGTISINNDKAAKALDMAAGWVGTISPQGVLNYAEEDARGVFQNGKAAFMRNWPYAWSLSQGADSRVKDKVGVADIPAGSGADGKAAAALGGWQLAVSKYSANPELAAELVMYLTSEQTQKKRAIEGSYNPTYPSLYEDKDVLAANPFFADLLSVLQNAVPRPSTVTGMKYNEVSQSFWNAAHEVLSGKTDGANAVKKLEARLKRVQRGKW
ncbi:MAG: ABC transporter substrate-binding protein [Lautropia sp.]|nr:ABC transporter substrate-binding protein [Lautropia sp.]